MLSIDTLEPEFVVKVLTRIDDEGDKCWLWKGAIAQHFGYGTVTVNKKKKLLAHRVVYAIFKGPLADDVMVLHSCDNPPCVRPDHLFEGTHQDNMDDMKQKDRRAKGINSNRSHLTDDDVAQMRYLYENGVSQKTLTNLYNLAHGTVWAIVTNRTWTHVPLTKERKILPKVGRPRTQVL